MKSLQETIDKIADVVLAYHPRRKAKKAKTRKVRTNKINANRRKTTGE